MADNFLERQRRDYEQRKQQLLNAHKLGQQSVAKRLLRSRDDYAD